ncbi:hypothetical protein BST96_01390 [Oceanicoccus sagamiensis]|uniref:Protein kinase domain-containing protein n=1 Tax=Oceanicoccus sagamiensis TaxID=716816 RepID=A0A1X9NFF8_9GAMM|nr:hypothetical protein BST96_01390 [Oceanicoccus sagamiensis]
MDIDKQLYIGKGLDRECYLHPEDSSKCIKITVSGDYRQHRDDIKYYHRLQKRDISWQHLAQFHGLCSTSLGDGLMFEVVRDHDGSISKSLRDYIRGNGCPIDRQQLDDELARLKSYLLKHSIIMRDLKDDNLLLQRLSDSEARLVVIDGIGNNEFIPFSELAPVFTNMKINRKWAKFSQKLQAKL